MTETEIDAQVDRLRTRFKSMNIVDRQVYDGDAVSIDVVGTVDGEAVPGLTAEDYLYEVGSATVVPELDTNLIGASAGQTLTFDAAVPGDDEAERIDFVVTVKNVQEQVLPEANDEWASTTSEFSTIAELRADIAKRMGTIKRMQASMAMRDESVKALVDLVDAETPETLVNSEIERRIQDLAQRLQTQQGATIGQYLEATGQTQQQLMDEARESAVEAVRADLALRAVIEAEAIEASDEDVDTEITRLAERFKMKPKKVRSNLEKSYQLGVLKTDICKAKAVTWLAEHATAVDEEGKPIDPSLLIFSPTEFDKDSFGTGSTVEFDDHEGHDHEGHDHDHEGHDHD
jgi:trigger factor